MDSKENNLVRLDKSGMQDQGSLEVEENKDEEENWEWDIRESGGGGRVKGKKTKSRARLPEEWAEPHQPMSPTPATVALNQATVADPGPFDSKAPNSSPNPFVHSAPAEIPSFTDHSHTSLVTSPCSYKQMCVNDFPASVQNNQKTYEEKLSTSRHEPHSSSAASAAIRSGSGAGDASGSLALMTGDNLSPVSQTFSFLDSVLQTPPGSTPDIQTNTPSLVTAALTPETFIPSALATSDFSPINSTTEIHPKSALSTNSSSLATTVCHAPTFATGSVVNVDAKSFIPSATLMTPTAICSMTTTTPAISVAAAFVTGTSTSVSPSLSTPPQKNEVTPFSQSGTAPQNIALLISQAKTTSTLSSTNPTVPPSLPAHSEHQETSPSQLPPLEGW